VSAEQQDAPAAVFYWIVLVGCGHWFHERVTGDVIPVNGEERFCSVHMRKFPAVYLPSADLSPLGKGWGLLCGR
jgi:hypothetical protein